MFCLRVIALLVAHASAFDIPWAPTSGGIDISASRLSRRAVAGAGAAAALGLVTPAFAEETISPAKAKILAAKQAQEAKLAASGSVSGTPKVQARADSSAQGRSGKAQSAQEQQKRIMRQQAAEKKAELEAREEARAIARANEKPPSLPSVSLPKLF